MVFLRNASDMGILKLVFTLLVLPIVAHAQTLLSERVFEGRDVLLPYDIPYILPLADKQFVMLSERKKKRMTLARYDAFVFESWTREVALDITTTVPQILLKGDSVIIYNYTLDIRNETLYLDFRCFNVEDGTEIDIKNYTFPVNAEAQLIPQIAFSDDHSKFVVYNLADEAGMLKYLIYSLGNAKPLCAHTAPLKILGESAASGVHLSNSGDLLLATANADNFKAAAYFWKAKSREPSVIESNYMFSRPAESIVGIDIVRQGLSSYFISFSANIGDELIGFGILGVNVVLKNVMFSHNVNLDYNRVQQTYDGYYFTSEKQGKRRLQVPGALDNFRQSASLLNQENDIIVIFEELQAPTGFHHRGISDNMPWQHRFVEDLFYYGGDMLLYCFSERGELKWSKVIQKSQFSQSNTLGLSYIPNMKGNQLDLFCYETAGKDNFYIFSLNTSDGSLSNKINLLPNDRYEFAKRYSAWLGDRTLLLFGITPTNTKKRKLLLMEY
jgi:hypothetical protein